MMQKYVQTDFGGSLENNSEEKNQLYTFIRKIKQNIIGGGLQPLVDDIITYVSDLKMNTEGMLCVGMNTQHGYGNIKIDCKKIVFCFNKKNL